MSGGRGAPAQNVFTSTFPLLAHRKQSSLGATGTEVSRLRPPASHTFSTSWSLLKSTLTRCTPSQGTLGIIWPLVEGVLRQFKVLLLGHLVVSGCWGDKSGATGQLGVSAAPKDRRGTEFHARAPLTLSFGLCFGEGGTEWISGFLTGLGSTVGEIEIGLDGCANWTAGPHNQTCYCKEERCRGSILPAAIGLYGCIQQNIFSITFIS